LPAPELLSILDETARPEKPDYLRVVAAVVIAVLLAVAIRVTLYYSTRQVRVDATPLEQRAKYAPLPAAAAAQSNPEPVDDTIYWAESGITLPLLRFKSEPLQANSAGTVVLIAVIDSSGKPVNMQVRQGLNPDLNVLAMQAASRWRFRPGTKDGKPVPVAAQLEVNFRGP
jgi:TonB family protein